MVWPPLTMLSAPRLLMISRNPSPGATLATPIGFRPTFGRSGRGGRRCIRLRLAGVGAVEHVVVLGGHVLDLELAHASARRRRSDQAGGVAGVDMDAHQLRVPNHERRFAKSGELGADRIDIEPGAVQQELGAVPPALFARGDRRRATTRHR